MSELRDVPNIGKQTERDLIALGYTSVQSLKGIPAERLYAEECALRGERIDRCQLYLYRAVEYYVNSETPDVSKCPWWLWKDEFVEPSPCGAVCVECDLFPKKCSGCRKIKGKVHWLMYTGESVCGVFDCCVNVKGKKNCGECGIFPCERFVADPTISDEENRKNLFKMIGRLKKG